MTRQQRMGQQSRDSLWPDGKVLKRGYNVSVFICPQTGITHKIQTKALTNDYKQGQSGCRNLQKGLRGGQNEELTTAETLLSFLTAHTMPDIFMGLAGCLVFYKANS